MSLIWILLSMSVAIVSTQTISYKECRRHTYKAKCLREYVRLQQENIGLRKFPEISNIQTCIQLKDNAISSFPIDLTQLSHVVTLDLSGNSITRLPKNLNAMVDLEILDLSRNQIRQLSSSTRFPASLRGLLLAGNGLTTIPRGFQVPKLFVLDLSQNQFAHIPEHFCVSDQLIRVDFNDNPISHDMSAYMGRLSKCRNANAIPYCLFISHRYIDCDCSILDYLVNESTFLMGSSVNDYQEMQCSDQGSTPEFAGRRIFDLVEANMTGACNFRSRKSSSTGDKNAASSPRATVLSLSLVVAATVCLYRTLF